MTDTDPWKPCDLRGVFPTSVSEDLFRRVGKAAGSEVVEGARVLVGGDVRISTSALKAALIQGLASTGLHVVDAGCAPTPVLYFAAKREEAAAVFVVTASHNPPSHNGLKWMIGSLPPSPENLTRIRWNAESSAGREGRGSCEALDPTPAYFEWIVSRWQNLRGRDAPPLILDPGNGAWSRLAPRVFQELGFDVHTLHGNPDGRFPSRSPDCARTENLAALREAVLARPGALGVAWDGDGDRVAFVDEDGVHASTDEISILYARGVLGRSSASENVVCDIKLSDSVRREVLRLGAIPLLERSGHAFMRSRLLSTNAILGLDACGHYFFREAGMRDDGLYSALSMLALLSGQSLGELRRSIGPIFTNPELRLPAAVLDFESVQRRLRAAFPDAEESNLDGIRLELDEGLVLARESTTEPVVSLRIEGFSQAGYDRLIARCSRCLDGAQAHFGALPVSGALPA